jgi:hypothetical protein
MSAAPAPAPAPAPSKSVVLKVLEDGRIELSGGTYPLRETIRAHGGRWNPADRVWTLPAGTDMSFVPPAPAAAAVAAAAPPRTYVFPVCIPHKSKPREEWTLEEWHAYVRANYSKNRGYVGACCRHATPYEDHPYGPINYRCEKHGVTRNSYSGT